MPRPQARLRPRLAGQQRRGEVRGQVRVGVLRGPGAAPYQTFLELGALAGAVPSARLHARLVLLEWGLAALSDDIEVMLSELVTNGVRASRATGQAAVRIWLVSDLRQVVVFVWDASPQPPARADPGADAESGHGLLLVEALSDRWGYFSYDGDGKVGLRQYMTPPAADASRLVP